MFRCAHTIKGSGGLFGLDEVVRFTHVVEDVLDLLRQGKMQFDSALISLLLECQDHISNPIAAVAHNTEVPVARSDELLVHLQAALGNVGGALVPSHAPTTDAHQPEPTASGGGAMGSDHWHLSLRFGKQVFQDGMDPLSLIRLRRKKPQWTKPSVPGVQVKGREPVFHGSPAVNFPANKFRLLDSTIVYAHDMRILIY